MSGSLFIKALRAGNLNGSKKSQLFSSKLTKVHSGFLEPWCYLENQTVFSSVFSITTVIKNASSTDGVEQWNSFEAVEKDTSTDVVTICT